jgi:hypothetical protein
MHSSTAYFAGAGTVVVAVVAGLGGGLLFANMITPKTPKMEQTHLERRMSPEPIQASKGPAEPVPYVAAPQPGTPGVAAAVVPAQVQSPQAPPQTETASSTSTPPEQPADTPPVQPTDNSAATQKADTSAATEKAVSTAATPPANIVTQESAAASEGAMAKVRDGDLKRTVEKRKAERRQQWTERRRRQPRQEFGQDRELREVEEIVREETEPRRELRADPVRIEMPGIRLFGPE